MSAQTENAEHSDHVPTSDHVQQTVDHNLKWYVRHQTFREPLFWGPILIIAHLKLANMPLSQIFYSEVVAICIILLLNIKAGIWADKIGHLKVMKVGEVILFASFLVFAFMSTTWHAWLANCLWAIGFACIDGADHSYLHENLKVANREHEHNHQNISSTRYRFLLTCITSLAAGFLAEIHMRLPLLLSIPPMMYSVYAMWKLKNPPCMEPGHQGSGRLDVQKKKKSNAPSLSKEIFGEACMTVRNNVIVLWAALFFSVTMVVNKIWFFTYNDYFAFVDLPIWMYGFIFMLINIGSYLTVRYAKQIVPEGKEVTRGMIIVSTLALCPLLQGLFPLALFAFIPALHTFSRTLAKPIVSHIVHNASKSSSRATTQSIIASCKDTLSVVSLALFGIVSGNWPINIVLIVLGGVALVCVFILYIVFLKCFKKGSTV